MNILLLSLALPALSLAEGLQDPKIEALEMRVAELEQQVAALQTLIKAFIQGQAMQRDSLQRGIQRAKETSCANTLRTLWNHQQKYAEEFGGPAKKFPDATGGAFWLALAKTDPPLVSENALEVFVCPVRGDDARANFTTYRGPVKKASELKAADPVGCCVHAGGNVVVLYKSGEVKTLDPEDAAAKAAVEATK